MPGSLAARDISKSFAAHQVLDRVSLVVSPGDRIGIVGPNGIGKSTLLRCSPGSSEPDAGQVIRSGAVGYLPQEPAPGAGETVLGYLARRTGVGAGRGGDGRARRAAREPSRSSRPRTRTRSTASSRSAARTSSRAPVPYWPTSGSAPGPSRR